MRKYYIDNIRILCILFLFPYHTCMIYNGFESFYVHGQVVQPLSDFVIINWPWFMPVMFTIAGMSASFALRKRTAGEFAKERITKLLIPLVFGIILLIPAQTYIAERFHNGYTGGYFEQYILFFTKQTDLTGYNGGFTPAQLWFILYLFVISMLTLPLMIFYNKSAKKLDGAKFGMVKIVSMFLIPMVMTPILNIAGKSVGQYFALFMLGFLVFSLDEVLDRLEKYRWILAGSAAILLTVLLVVFRMGYASGLLFDIFYMFLMWICILAILGMGKHFLNFNNKFTVYFSKAAFPIYIFHQSWLVAVGYFALKITDIVALQILMTVTVSFGLTILTYEIARKIPITRFMFGIK